MRIKKRVDKAEDDLKGKIDKEYERFRFTD